MTRRTKLILLVGVGVLFIVIILAAAFRSGPSADNQANITTDSVVPDIFSAASVYDKDSVVLSNSHAFIKYNYKTGQTDLLTPDDIAPSLQNVDKLQMSADKRYIIFHTQESGIGGKLETLLTQKGQDATQPYWWVYDTGTKQYRNLPQAVNTVALRDNTLYALEKTEDAPMQLTSYNLPTLKKLSGFTVPQSLGLFVAPDHFVLETADSTILSTKNGIVSNQIAADTDLLTLSKDGRAAVGLVDDDNGRRLVRFDLSRHTQQIIVEKVTDQAVDSTQNLVFFGRGDNEDTTGHGLYNVATGKLTTLDFSKNSLLAGAGTAGIVGEDAFLMLDQVGNLHLAGNGVKKLKDITKLGDEAIVTVNGRDIELRYFPDDKTVTATIDSDAVTVQKQAIYDYLKKNGYNPALLDLELTVFTPIPPTPDPGN